MQFSKFVALPQKIAAMAMVFCAIPAHAVDPPGNPIFPGWYADPEAVIFDQTCWIYPTSSAAYAIADSPFGPFTRIGKLLQQNPVIATGAGHHSVIHLPNEDRWFTIYHRRPLTETDANSREVCIDEMRFNQQGLIQPEKITNEGVKAVEIR